MGRGKDETVDELLAPPKDEVVEHLKELRDNAGDSGSEELLQKAIDRLTTPRTAEATPEAQFRATEQKEG